MHTNRGRNSALFHGRIRSGLFLSFQSVVLHELNMHHWLKVVGVSVLLYGAELRVIHVNIPLCVYFCHTCPLNLNLLYHGRNYSMLSLSAHVVISVGIEQNLHIHCMYKLYSEVEVFMAFVLSRVLGLRYVKYRLATYHCLENWMLSWSPCKGFEIEKEWGVITNLLRAWDHFLLYMQCFPWHLFCIGRCCGLDSWFLVVLAIGTFLLSLCSSSCL